MFCRAIRSLCPTAAVVMFILGLNHFCRLSCAGYWLSVCVVARADVALTDSPRLSEVSMSHALAWLFKVEKSSAIAKSGVAPARHGRPTFIQKT